MKYGVANQLLWLRAFNTDGYVEDDEGNITCDLIVDGGSPIALGNPVQAAQKRGAYYYILTEEQTTGHALKAIYSSATPGVQVLGTPDMIYTDNSISLGEVLEFSDGDAGQTEVHRVSITKVN